MSTFQSVSALLSDEAATLALGQRVAQLLPPVLQALEGRALCINLELLRFCRNGQISYLYFGGKLSTAPQCT